MKRALAILLVTTALAACETMQPVAGAPEDAGAAVALGAATPPSPDPKDDLDLGKRHFAERSFGLAEKHFRLATEKTPQSAEAWLGLAAAYDQLRRFELADRAYTNVLRIVGPSAEVLNNRGLSYMMRGDLTRAHKDLVTARSLDRDNPRIANNLTAVERRLNGAGR